MIKDLYLEAAMYAYYNVEKEIERLDKTMVNKAVASMFDRRPVDEISSDLLNKFVIQKAIVLEFNERMTRAWCKLTPAQQERMDSMFGGIGIDNRFYTYQSRYKMNHLFKKLGEAMEQEGITDDWFKTEGRKFMSLYIRKVKTMRDRSLDKEYGLRSPFVNKGDAVCQ